MPSHYGAIIREAFEVELTDRVVDEIEEVMRDDIFHSTLDWQSREQLRAAAREAFKLLDPDDKAAT